MLKIRLVLLTLLTAAMPTLAQTVSTAYTISGSNQAGTPENGSFEGALENINLQNGNVSIALPLLHLPGVAGHDLDLKLLINSKVYGMWGGKPGTYNSDGTKTYTPPGFGVSPAWTTMPFAGGHLNIPALTSSYVSLSTTSYDGMGIPTTLLAQCNTGYTFFDQSGAAHGFGNLSGCVGDAHPNNPAVNYTESSDGAFYRLDTTNSAEAVVYDRSGIQYHFPTAGGVTIVDPSGNTIAISQSGTYPDLTYTITDTVGHLVTVTSSSVSYRDSNGNQQSISATATDLGNQAMSFVWAGGSSTDGQYGYVYAGTQNFTIPSTKYTLSYPSGEQFALTYTGFKEISKIQYPSGGYTSYAYQSIPGAYIDSNWRINADIREIQTKTVCPNSSGSCASNELLTTTYTPYSGGFDGNSSMEVQDPAGNLSHVDFYGNSYYPTYAEVEKQRLVYSGNGSSKALWKTITSAYTDSTPTLCSPNVRSVTTTLSDVTPNLTSRVEYDYQTVTLSDDTYTYHGDCGTTVQGPNVTAKREYDYDGSLVRTTTNSWLSADTSAPHFLDRQTGTSVSGGGITSTHGWDYTSTGLVLDESVGGTNATTGTITYGHDSHGRLTSAQDARLNSTTYDYTTAWENTNAACPAGLSVSPTTVTDALQHASHAKFDACTGTLNSSQDVNGNTTTFKYDASLRNTKQANPDGGGTDTTYSSGAGTSVTTSQKLDSRSISSVVVHDGIGRKQTVQNTSDPNGTVSVDYTYAPLGGIASVSNPHYGTGGSQFTSYQYDALARPTLTTDADSVSTRQQIYSGNTVYTVDESNAAKALTYDSLGRLTSVTENAYVPHQNGLSCGTACQGGPTTSYTYNALNDLTGVTQAGSQTRSFTYNGRSQLLTANNPETGPVCYGQSSSTGCANGYDANGNLVAKTDARGITTTYGYDALNRLTGRSYSDSTPSDSYWYDTAPSWMSDSQNIIGRLANSANGYGGGTSGRATAAAYSYDTMGRIVRKWEQTPSASPGGLFTYSLYNLAGNPTDMTYPDGTQITNSYDSAGRLLSVNAGTSQAQGNAYVSSITYEPSGAVHSTVYGNGVTQTLTHNARLQPCQSTAVLPASLQNATAYDLRYFYGSNNTVGQECSPVSGNNGNILHIVDTLNAAASTGNYSQDFSYDILNRLAQWNAPNMSGSVRSQTYNYDSFGNMWQSQGYSQNGATVGTSNARMFPNPNASWGGLGASSPYTTSNQLAAGYHDCLPAGVSGTPGQVGVYDAAGNLLCGGSNTDMNAKQFAWDGAGRMAQINSQQNGTSYYKTADYVYNEDGNRARSNQYDLGSGNLQSWREYNYFSGQSIADRDQDGHWTDYIFANGQRIARIRQATASPTTVSGYHFQGNTTNSSVHNSDFWNLQLGYIQNGSGIGYYTVQAGDKLEWKQYTNNVNGAFRDIFYFQTGSDYYMLDQNGLNVGTSPVQNTWVTRTADLSNHVGNTFQVISVGGLLLGTGHWDIWISGLGVRHADGSFTAASSTLSPVLYMYADSTQTGGTATTDTMTIPPPSATVATMTYTLSDQVGTTTLEFDAAGHQTWQGFYAPFGQELDIAATDNRYKFTGKERDQESGLDYFGARYYASNVGRFMSPDWTAKIEPVPYSKLEDPQSLNLYAYVQGNPVSRIDPDGHACPECRALLSAMMDGVDSGNALWAAIQAKKEAQQQSSSGEGSASNVQKRDALAAAAGDQYHSTKWNPKGGYSQCNVFVCAMLDKVGLDGPRNSNGHPITAGQWADPKFAIDNWRVLGGNEAAAPGDVAAVAMPGAFSNASGHMGIVSDLEGGTPHIMAAGSPHVYRTSAANFEPNYTIVYRRYVGP